jgi:thioester reductase-like protein
MPLTLFTGMPGFIGTRLVRRLLAAERDRGIACIVQPEPAILDKAWAVASEEGAGGRIEVIPGDISKPGLALAPEVRDRLAAEVDEAWHLAALYNLAAPKETSYRVNVDGTRHILDLCERARGLRRLHYVSTYAVAGDRSGVIYERELEMGQRFRNYYEETKFLAEVEVRRRAGEVPAAIIRPAAVVGDSRTGEIDKYDGPYYMIAALARLEREGRIQLLGPMLGLGRAPALFHIAPVDYILDSMLAVRAAPDATGKTFHVVDPDELTVAEVREQIFGRFGVRVPRRNISASLARSLMAVPGMEALARVPRQVFDYFDVMSVIDATNCREVNARAGVVCPPFKSYVDRMVAFVRSRPDVRPVLA